MQPIIPNFAHTAAKLIHAADATWAYRRQLDAIHRMAGGMAYNLQGTESWHVGGLRAQIDICRQMVRTIDPADYSAEDADLIEIDSAISADWQALADIATARVAEIEAAIAAR